MWYLKGWEMTRLWVALHPQLPQATIFPMHHYTLPETTNWFSQSSLASMLLTPTISYPKAWTHPEEGSSSPSAPDPAHSTLLAHEALVWYLSHCTYSYPWHPQGWV